MKVASLAVMKVEPLAEKLAASKDKRLVELRVGRKAVKRAAKSDHY